MGQQINFYCIIAFYKNPEDVQRSQIVQVPYIQDIPTDKELQASAKDLMRLLLQEGNSEIALTLLTFKKEPPIKELEAYAYDPIPISEVMDFMKKYVKDLKIYAEAEGETIQDKIKHL